MRPVDPDVARRDWILLAAATTAFGVGFSLSLGTLPSFAAGYLGIGREQLGLLESLREVPGLLTAAMMGLAAAVAEPRLALLCLAILGIGLGAQGGARDFWSLVACNMFWSVGLHIWLTLQPALTLSLTQEGRHGYGVGMMGRFQAAATIAGLVLALALSRWAGYLPTFVLAGLFVIGGGIIASRIRTRTEGLRQRLVFRPAYWRYYGLMLLDGGRRQVVQTFAVLILVKEFGAGRPLVAGALLVANLVTTLAAPLVGRWTDRFGERTVLSVYYSLVALLFLTYTQVESLGALFGVEPVWVFCGLYAFDNLLFTGSVGIQTYIRHTAPPGDLAPSLAMGLTWNHIAAVVIPIAAGLLWERYGYARIFQWGVGLALCSLAMCFTLPSRPARVETEP